MRYRLWTASSRVWVPAASSTTPATPAFRSRSAISVCRPRARPRRPSSLAIWQAMVVAPQPPLAETKPSTLPRLAGPPLNRTSWSFRSTILRRVKRTGG